MHVLENEMLRVTVADHGAELSGIYDKRSGQEILWEADPAYWNRHAPILFPFVGKVNGGVYRYQGVSYPMGQHGFARDMEFVCCEKEAQRIVHRLDASEETFARYPFLFSLYVTHELAGNTLTVSWRVENRGTEAMYFSIGAHPAFRVPKDGYSVQFEKETLTYVLIDPESGGVAYKDPKTLSIPGGSLPLTRELFDRDALIFDGTQVERVLLCYPDGSAYVTMECPGFPSFGLWSKPKSDAPFVCLEPWIGRCDNVGFAGELNEKFGEQCLEVGGVFTTSYRIKVNE